MITAIENRELYRYEIHSLLKAFYPKEDVKVLTQEDAAGNRKYQQIAREPFLRVFFAEKNITIQFCGTQKGPGQDQAGADGSIQTDADPSVRADAEPSIQVHAEPSTQVNGEPPIRADEPVPDAGACTVEAPAGVSFLEKGPVLKTELKHLLYRMLSEREGRTLPWGELIGIRPTKIAMQSLLDGRTVAEAAADMERDHLVSPAKALLCARIAQREREILADIHYENGYSLYIGIPFCPTTCLYCSFPSFNLSMWKGRVDEYLDALEREMEACASMMQGRILDTIYVGGGTPTTLEPAQLERLFAMVEACFPVKDLQELTVEAGRPDSITADKLRVLKAHDVTRISVNPQSMKEETLRLIGRRHTVDDVRRAFSMCREAGFDNINMDIILGLPQETEEDVRHTLQEIEKLSPDSLTVHSLALKRGSRMQKYIAEKGYSFAADTEGFMEIAGRSAAAMGMEPYYLYRQKNISGNLENVGFARAGKAGIYNILIMEEKQSILALGAGSISKAVFPREGRIERSDNPKDVETYIKNVGEMIERKHRLAIGLQS